MKNRITVSVAKDGKMEFYYIHEKNSYYLFSQAFTSGVYNYFRNGRAEGELYEFNKWKENWRLGKTIERIPAYTRYLKRFVI